MYLLNIAWAMLAGLFATEVAVVYLDATWLVSQKFGQISILSVVALLIIGVMLLGVDSTTMIRVRLQTALYRTAATRGGVVFRAGLCISVICGVTALVFIIYPPYTSQLIDFTLTLGSYTLGSAYISRLVNLTLVLGLVAASILGAFVMPLGGNQEKK